MDILELWQILFWASLCNENLYVPFVDKLLKLTLIYLQIEMSHAHGCAILLTHNILHLEDLPSLK